MQINHKTFFDGFKEHFDSSLDQAQVNGIEFLLTAFEQDAHWKDPRHVAYALATIYHETAASMQPVEEGYYLGSKARVERFQKTLRYYPYFGRGYVQLTWKTNYQRAGKALALDLVNKPELALDKETAFEVLTLGMFNAWFTSHKLQDHIHGSVTDYRNARRIINGTDKAGLIAGYAEKFERLLKASATTSQSSTDSKLPTAVETTHVDTAIEPAASLPSDSTTSVEQTTTTVETPLGNATQTVTTATVTDTVSVQGVAMGLWSKVIAGFGAVTALGINAGTVIESKLSEITANQLIMMGLGVALLVVTIFYFKKRQEAADAKTHALIQAAASKDHNTVVLTQ